MYSNVPLQLPSLIVTTNYYIFPLGGVDVILGIAWLEILGDVQANCAKMSEIYS